MPPSAPSLSALPDDVLLRILHLSGPPPDQIGLAYRLASLCARFRHLLHRHFLPSLTALTADSLRRLSLAHPRPARHALASLCTHAVSIRSLTLAGLSPRLLSQAPIKALAHAARGALTRVHLSYCQVDDDVLFPLLTCPKLVSLALPCCKGVSGSMFAREGRVAPLAVLDLSWVHTLSADGVRAVARMDSLTTLVFKGCEALNSRTLTALAAAPVAASVLHLGLAFCPVNDAALLLLVERAKSLKKIELAEASHNLWPTGNYSERCVEEIRAVFPHVEIVFTAS